MWETMALWPFRARQSCVAQLYGDQRLHRGLFSGEGETSQGRIGEGVSSRIDYGTLRLMLRG